MSSTIAKAYEPREVEARWRRTWLDHGCFKACLDLEKEPFSIVMPPPNVTGVLHMGHVLNNTLQDILVRHARQQGKGALWLPGTDHAGIATQTRVERELRKEGLTRRDLGREKFMKRAVQWRDAHGGIILEQMKRLGVSCDWERNVHTLDEGYSRAVCYAFVQLFERGYIYRGKRMVNWCPVSLTALSDEEVVMKPQCSTLYTMRYELADEPGVYLEIATTRPETVMGDAAVAVHPEDERYCHLIGQHCWRPFPRARIPVVGDPHVDRAFGTGVLKVTPAHDKADFEIGQRHGLPVIDVLNPDGTLNEKAGPDFVGMERFAARTAAAQKLAEMGLLIGEEPYENMVGFSERADVPIEPRLSEQWFLRYPKVAESKRAVSAGLVRFHPERWAKIYLHWLDHIQDWCISRQLWWGHRIPVWYRRDADRSDPANWHVSVDGPVDAELWEQDADVLDTWASSWLWPFATLGWPEPDAQQVRELDFWNPTSVLVTAPDILFFWVARMIMASLEFKGESKASLSQQEIDCRIPFRDVYFNGLVRDAKGRKMSKSLGNSPDPIDLIDRFGADGVRFGLLGIAPRGQDVLFCEERVAQGRNFCNKLWNACRLRQMSGGECVGDARLEAIVAAIDTAKLVAYDHAIITRLKMTLNQVGDCMEGFEFNAAHQALYGFFWNDFCDLYLEVCKIRMKDSALRAHCLAIQDLCLRQSLLMLHPFIPFITEELWHGLGYAGATSDQLDYFIQNVDVGRGSDLESALRGHGLELNSGAVQEVDGLREFVSKARAFKAQRGLAAKSDVTFSYTADDGSRALIEREKVVLKMLIGAAGLEFRSAAMEGVPAVVAGLGTLYLDCVATVDAAVERERLSKEIARLDTYIQANEGRLRNVEFLTKAPVAIVDGTKAQLAETRARRRELAQVLAGLGDDSPANSVS